MIDGDALPPVLVVTKLCILRLPVGISSFLRYNLLPKSFAQYEFRNYVNCLHLSKERSALSSVYSTCRSDLCFLVAARHLYLARSSKFQVGFSVTKGLIQLCVRANHIHSPVVNDIKCFLTFESKARDHFQPNRFTILPSSTNRTNRSVIELASAPKFTNVGFGRKNLFDVT